MMNTRNSLALLLLATVVLLAGCERPRPDTVQRGYRGTGTVEVHNPRVTALKVATAQAPEPLAAVPAGGPAASSVYKNVQVLGDVDAGELTRLMLAMTQWVAPQQGCAYCHAGADFAADTLYTKVVARRMLQMTRHINSDWKTHVGDTGVTCYTCHRGQNVPSEVWFTPPAQKRGQSFAGNKAGQNAPAASVALAALPYDPFTPFLSQSSDVRVVGDTPLATGNRHSIKQTEWTYSLMMHMSDALGVNCTYCHNSRSFTSWDTSTPQRATAWYGIRMARDLNSQYLESLSKVVPAHRLGSEGDAPKLNCATCHQAAFKPLYGAPMLKDYPQLGVVAHAAAAAPEEAVAQTKP